jgi:glycosyltransferase involved in cell wall biosynthesis
MAAEHELRVLHVCASDLSGGAARASYRVHRALVDHGAEFGLSSRLRVMQQLSDDPTVCGGPPAGAGALWQRLQPHLNDWARRGFRSGRPGLHSIAWPATGLGRELQASAADLIQLHWLGDHTLSIEEIGRLPQPLVWRLPDQWAFCGAEHYSGPADDAAAERYVCGYSPASRPPAEQGPDLNRRTWLRKQRAWRRPMQIVCTSSWLAGCVRRSALMADWPLSVIPNPLDLTRLAPFDQRQARALLDLPPDRPLVLFGALDTADPRKGGDLLLAALQQLRAEIAGGLLDGLELLVFGQGRPAEPPDVGVPIRYAGMLHDDVSLRLVYAAADVMVVPSRQEAFGQTASEAQACGTPVVAFRSGGPLDIVADRETGALAEPFSAAALAQALRWVLADHERRLTLGAAARRRAEALFAPRRIAGLYAEVYRAAIAAD